MDLIDTHAHLYDPSLAEQLPDLMARADESDVRQILVIGVDLETSLAAVKLAETHPMLRAVVGYQPNHCQDLTENKWNELLKLIAHPKVVGIGETGLDRYWDDCPFDTQWHWFGEHLSLAQQHELPLVIHMRDCEADIVAFLNRHADRWPIQGVMHSFTGSLETARACLNAGLHISFAGMLTFKNSHDLRSVAKAVPADRLLVETDSPYLSPEPMRGKRPNEPARVRYTAECLAEIRGLSLAEIATITSENARALFGLEAPATFHPTLD